MDWSQVAVVVPARMASTRLPGKLARRLHGVPVLEWTLRALQRLPLPDGHLAVATGDQSLCAIADRLGIPVLPTPADLPSGTHRVAVASQQLPAAARWVVNVQGDEPLIDPEVVQTVLAAILPDDDMATAACPIHAEEWRDPNTVKAIYDRHGRALWFTRAPEPHRLSALDDDALADALHRLPRIRRHLGVYAFRRDRIAEWPDLPACPLASSAGLEQLAALSAGWTIRVATVARPRGPAVDTAADLEAVRTLLTTADADRMPSHAV